MHKGTSKTDLSNGGRVGRGVPKSRERGKEGSRAANIYYVRLNLLFSTNTITNAD